MKPKKFKNKIVECRYTDKKSINITKKFLDNLWKSIEDSGKDAIIIIGVKKDEDFNYVLSCKIVTERRYKNVG
jgi:hypothetical protein